MTDEEALAVINVINERLNVYGGCKWLSLSSDDCPCAKCQIDRMSVKDIARAANKRLNGNTQDV
jgi:hypothetical protein